MTTDLNEPPVCFYHVAIMTEDLKAFERRLTEYVSCLQPATGRWRMILIVVSVCTATGAWNWLIDPDTQKVSFFSSLWNHPFFTISCVTLIALFFAGIHKRVVAPSIIAARCRTVLAEYNMSCDDYGENLFSSLDRTSSNHTAPVAVDFVDGHGSLSVSRAEMGKSKTTKFKRPQFNSVGLPVNAVKEEEEGEEEHDDDSCPAAELLEKLQSPSADVREFACASISRVVQQSQTISGFLQRDAVRRLGPMLLDSSLAVRETATGALRNLSACGGQEVCEDMVKHDVMTPLTALLRECCAGFESAAEPMKEQKNAVEDVANEAVNLLWNLCESSSQALSMFNKAGLLDVVIQCLERHPQNVELAISAAHCLHTVTEDNAELLCSLNTAVLKVLENVLLSSQPSMAHTLLRTLAAGTLWNMKASLPAAHQAQTLNAVVATLSRCLDLDTGTLIPELRQAEVIRHRNTPAASDTEEQAPVVVEEMDGEEEEEEEEGPKHRKNGKAVRADNDFSDLLPRGKEELREATALLTAQQTSLEIIVNMCCSDDPSDDEWEEESSSDESDMGPDGLCDGVSNLMSPLCLSAEVHGALISHSIPEKVLKKTEFPRKGSHGRMPSECFLEKLDKKNAACAVPGADGAAQHLSTLVFGAGEIPKDEEFLEAVISAMRSLLQMIASKNIPQCMTPQQLMSLSEAATRCEVVSVRVNAVAILGITGSTLAKEKGTAETLQMIGNALLQVATRDADLVVNGEALDALFDVFADGDEAETAAKNIHLLPALKALQPVFKAKIRKEGRGKYSPQQLCVLDNIKVNLRRFIGYLEKVVKK
ncbi:HEAT repeat-containing protein 3 [Larimichthys crocea]|uniref:HEAT repeat-containing protein 3 n=1 Tax=Larimichthys crocea TaxID=215358 RepID=A0A6G0J188_LARCR|nr:HEAT repeat-containing protein 3 [Larimichthys crocea]